MRHPLLVLCAVLLVRAPAAAQISGTAFEDRDGDGIHDAGEPGLPDLPVQVFGRPDAGGTLDQTLATGPDGTWALSPGNGCYLVHPVDPPGWRMAPTRYDAFPEGTAGYTAPVGRARLAKLDFGIGNLESGTFRYASMGDSIAANFNLCSSQGSFWYSRQVRDRLLCTSPGTVFVLDETAVLGQDTDDLLVDDTADGNNVFRQIERQPDLITLSIIGNDMKDVDPPAAATQMDVDRAITEMIDSRQNLQEVLSSFVSEVPGADVTLNTLYDNLAYNCYAGSSTAFHRQWFPILNRVLRDLAWGQARRLSINEVGSEFAHEDQELACFGFDAQICRDIFGLDRIHPTNAGYTMVREKVWEGAGGVNLGPKDALGRTSLPGADHGFLRRVRRLHPTSWEARSGAAVTNPTAAFSDQDGGAAAGIALGIGPEEVRFAGFPDWWDEIEIVRVIAGVRYRTSGTVGDDVYRIEASVNDQFRAPPGHAYTPTSWNFFTPLVGGGGPNNPPLNADFPAIKVLVRPNLASDREVSATLTKNPVLVPGQGQYVWPAVSHADLATTTIRVAAAPVASTPGNDAYQVQLDAAWLDLYGYEKPRPGEVTQLRLDRLPDGTVEASFDALPGAQRYNVYQGSLETLRAGGVDHGAGATCVAPTQAAGEGRLKVTLASAQQEPGSTYWLATAHVDGVESPSHTPSGGAELDRAHSTCH